MKADDQVLQIFREECHERLARIEASLLAVEGGDADPGTIDALFRDAHSIQSSIITVKRSGGFWAIREQRFSWLQERSC